MTLTLTAHTDTLFRTFKLHPGAYAAVAWTSEVKPAAEFKAKKLVKHADAVVRVGIDYSHLGVNEGVETGELPWGEWHTFPYVIVHKGSEYVRLYIADKECPKCEGTGETLVTPDDADCFMVECSRCYGTGRVPRVKTRYTVDGVTVDREEFLSYLTPAARKPSRPIGGTITVKAASVTLR